jgi:hypothetical protein
VAKQSAAYAVSSTLYINNQKADINLYKQGLDLVINFDDVAGQFRVINHYAGSGQGIDGIYTSDGAFINL